MLVLFWTPCAKYLSGISASNWLLESPECVGKVEEEVELVANAEELRLLDRLGAPFATVARRCWSSPWVWLQLAHCIAVHYIS